jgi:tryptophan halogenase
MNKLAILGVGSAGVQALCHTLSWLDESWEITSIHSPGIPVLGIGESSNPGFVGALELGTGFNIADNLSDLNATVKFGTKYYNWKKDSFVNPLIGGGVAIHFDTNRLWDFSKPRLEKRWGKKLRVLEDKVLKLEDLGSKVIIKMDKGSEDFDYVVDCRGFPSDLEDEDYYKPEPLLTTCLVHNAAPEVAQQLEFTGHIATSNGWMFRVPLQTRVSYGYLYNNKITKYKDAVEDFEKLVEGSSTTYTKYEFKPYINNNIIKGRIISCGNQAAFFEPMFANSLWLYYSVNKSIIDYIRDGTSSHTINRNFLEDGKKVLDIIAFHYKGGSNFNSPFWRYAKEWSDEMLKPPSKLPEYLEYLGTITKSNKGWSKAEEYVFGPDSLMNISRNLGYTYL